MPDVPPPAIPRPLLVVAVLTLVSVVTVVVVVIAAGRDGAVGGGPISLVASDGTVHRGEQIATVPAAGDDRLVALRVRGPIDGAPVDCVVVVHAGAEETHLAEGCAESDSSEFNRLFAVDDTAWLLQWEDGEAQLVRLGRDVTVAANGCDTPLLDTLRAVDAVSAGGMVAGLACDVDTVAALQPSIMLRPGPVNGLLFEFGRGGDGLHLIDAGTGVEPDPWPVDIPSAAVLDTGADAAG